MNRREFSKIAVAGSVGIGIAPTILADSGWKGATDRVNVAVIGIRGQGQGHIQSYSKLENVRVAALCDIDSNLFDERIKNHFTDKGLPKSKIYTDLRKFYEDKNIDTVFDRNPQSLARSCIDLGYAGRETCIS